MTLSMSTPEDQVVDALARINQLGVPFCAVHVAMSKLMPDNRGYRQLEIVSHLFEPLLNHARARLFLLSNKDFLLLTAYPVVAVIENVVHQIQSLFADDVLFSSSDKNSFSRIYFLDENQKELQKLLHVKYTPPVTHSYVAPQVPVREKTQVLTIDVLSKLIERINQTNNWNDFVRRKSAVSFNADATNEEVFQEFGMSVTDIEKKFEINVSLTSDRALFGILTQTLDKQMLKVLSSLNLTAYPKAVSVNLNMATVLLPEFDKMVQSLSCGLIVELQIADVMHQLPLFKQVCEKLNKLNIAVALDGIGINEFELLNLECFKQVQYVKFLWSPKWLEQGRQAVLKDFIARKLHAKAVMTRCADQRALLFGCQAGIKLFQGRFIDGMCAVATKAACTFGQECSLEDCMLRRSVLGGEVRNQCVHQPHLDIYTMLKGK